MHLANTALGQISPLDSAVEDAAPSRIAVAANFTAEPLEDSLGFWIEFFDWRFDTVFAPFDQIFQQLLSADGLFTKSAGGVNVLLIRLDSWWPNNPGEAAMGGAHENVALFISAMKQAVADAPVPYLVCLCPSAPTLSSNAEAQAWLDCTRRRLADGLSSVPGITLITEADVLDAYPVGEIHDPQAQAIGAIPYTSEFFAAMGTYLARRIYSLKRAPYKVIALDCDNTLWKGVIGEDGPTGIELTDRHIALQKFVVRQSQLGMLICLCSKNNEADVWEAFAAHPNMPLQREHIVAHRINWEPKSANLRALSDQLSLDLSSFCFIDDSPMECAQVRDACPQVLALPFPPTQDPAFLKNVWAFDRTVITQEDRQRTEQYRQNAARESERTRTATLADFLAALELRVRFDSLSRERVARVADLTQRTNQFNTTTIRRNEAEIAAMIGGSNLRCFTVDVSDRYGDYGLVGVAIYRFTESAVEVDSMLLSCRALGRGVEHRILVELGRIAEANGVARVDIPLIHTRKNQPARDFLEAVGSEYRRADAGADRYEIPVDRACAAIARVAEKPAVSGPVEKIPTLPAADDAVTQSAKLAQIAAEFGSAADVLRAISIRRGHERAGDRYVAPRNESQHKLAAIWQQVLFVDRVGAEDDFFSLGGTSLQAALMLARVQQQFGVAIALAKLLEHPVLSDLASAIASASADPPAATTVPARRREIVDRAPLSPIQSRFWLIDRAVGDRAVYNVCHRARIRGPLDVAALQRAWAAVVDRQESLRTQFSDHGGTVVQVVLPTISCALNRVDLRDRPAELDGRIAEEARLPFDLSAAPLWRVSLYQIADDEHVLSWSIHHILMDEGSRQVILRDLWNAYDRAVAGSDPRLPALPIRYIDFSAWQREHLDGDYLAEGLAHWKTRLAGTAPAVVPPHFKMRPRQRSGAGAMYRFEVPSQIGNAVVRQAREAGVTPFIIYLATFQALLFRYSNQPDLCIGTAATNRPSAGVDDVAGCFVNMVPVRADLSGDPTFRDLVVRARDAVADAMKYPDLSLEQIGGSQPLFQSAFIYHNDDVSGRTADGVTWEVEQAAQVGAKFDLSLDIAEMANGVVADIEFNTDLYTAPDAQRIAGNYLTLLAGACHSAATSISQLPLLSAEAYRQIVFDWNRTAGAYPRDTLIHQGFEDHARTSPNQLAIVSGGREFSYGQIEERANRLAHFLIEQGFVAGAFIGVCLKRSEEMIVAVLAVLKAGGAYVPFDAAYPKERLAFMLEDTQAQLVITQSALLDRLPVMARAQGKATAPRYLCLDQLGSELAEQSCELPKRATTPDDRAYVIFTSGSTGRPKGVVLRHRPVVNVLDWVNRTFNVSTSDRVLFVTSLSFDLSVYDIFGTLGAGASIRIASEEELRDPTALLAILKNEPVTIWDSAPAALSQLAPFFQSQKQSRGSVRLVMLSGDWIPVPLPDQVRNEFPDARVISLGGATEAAIWSNWYPINKVDPAWPSIPYGKPIRNARYHILDARLSPLPVGVPGELHIGGEVLADGYLKRDQLTRERFIDDPLVTSNGNGNDNGNGAHHDWPAGGKLYKTGDLARYLPDGNIEFLGRMDTQVKVRGFRVEAGEIETLLAQQNGVQDVVVKPHKDSSGQNYLVAYVVAKPGASLVAAEIIGRLQKQLPDYMVPSQIVFLDALPVTANGKLDRAALAAPAVDATRSAQRDYVKPASDAERALVTIWENVLGISPIGVTDDFHDLGGHSLRAALVMAQVELQLGHRIPIEVLLRKPTVRGLAEVITDQLELNGGVLVPLQTGGTHPPLFMIAGAGGHVFAFHAFARRLGPRFNVYGMRAVGIDGTEPPLESIPEIARRYLKEIQAACPQGPYVLSGYSIGGMIAFELAQQMLAAGMKVSRVVIFDMMAPGYPKKLPIWHRLYLHGRSFLGKDSQGKRKYLRERSEKLRWKIQSKFGRYTVAPGEVPGIDIVPHQRIYSVLSGLLKGLAHYWPSKPIDCQIVVVGSTAPLDWVGAVLDDPCHGWSAWTTKPVKLYQIDAPHTQFFRDDYIEQVARDMREVIENAKAEDA